MRIPEVGTVLDEGHLDVGVMLTERSQLRQTYRESREGIKADARFTEAHKQDLLAAAQAEYFAMDRRLYGRWRERLHEWEQECARLMAPAPMDAQAQNTLALQRASALSELNAVVTGAPEQIAEVLESAAARGDAGALAALAEAIPRAFRTHKPESVDIIARRGRVLRRLNEVAFNALLPRQRLGKERAEVAASARRQLDQWRGSIADRERDAKRAEVEAFRDRHDGDINAQRREWVEQMSKRPQAAA